MQKKFITLGTLASMLTIALAFTAKAHAETVYQIASPPPITVVTSMALSCEGGKITVSKLSGLGSVTLVSYKFPKQTAKETVFHWSNVFGTYADQTFTFDVGMIDPAVSARLETVDGVPLTESQSLGACSGGGGVFSPTTTISPASALLRVGKLGCGSSVAFQTMLGGSFPDGVKLVLTMAENASAEERSIQLVGKGVKRYTHAQFIGGGSGNTSHSYTFQNSAVVQASKCNSIDPF